MKKISRIHVLLFPLAVLFAMLMIPVGSAAQVSISVSFAPPALPVYEQPPCPGDGYIWTPGYWSYDNDIDDYYWVPGTWVMAPEPDYYWTPPYWAFENGIFMFHDGYWGPEVGFYGGIDYGFGYPGDGFYGGRWQQGRFFYNREVTNVNTTVIKNVYVQNVVHKTVVNRVSYNGDGGVNARPNAAQEAAARARHLPPAQAQVQHVRQARQVQQLRASVNQGKPSVAATDKPNTFQGRGIVGAKEAGAPYHPPANRAANRGNRPAGQPENNNARPENNPRANNNARPENNRPENNARPENNGRPATAVHPNDLPPRERPAPMNGNAMGNQKSQQRQQQLEAKQEQQRQKLQQKQDQEHQKMQRQGADQAKSQQMEQRHQQQTQKLEQKQEQQRAKAQPKQQEQKQNQSRQQKEKEKEQRPPSLN